MGLIHTRLKIGVFFVFFILLEVFLFGVEKLSTGSFSILLRESRATFLSYNRFLPSLQKSNPIALNPKSTQANILIIGNGFDKGVEPRKNFSSLIETEFGSSLLNLSGFELDLAQVNRMLEVGLRLTPKVVFYVISPENLRFPQIAPRPLTLTNSQERLVGDRELFTENNKTITQAFLSLFRMAANQSRLFEMMDWMQDHSHTSSVAVHSKHNQLSFPQLPALSNEEIDEFSNYVNTAYQFVDNHQKHFLVVLIPTNMLVYENLIKQNDLLSTLHLLKHQQAYAELNKRMIDLGIPVLDLYPRFKFLSDREKMLYQTLSPNLNELGHEEVANQLLDKIKESYGLTPTEDTLL